MVPGAASAGSVAPMTVRRCGHRVGPLQGHREAGAAGHEGDQLGVERAALVDRVEGPASAWDSRTRRAARMREARLLEVGDDEPGLAAGDGVGLDDAERTVRAMTIVLSNVRERSRRCSTRVACLDCSSTTSTGRSMMPDARRPRTPPSSPRRCPTTRR